MPFIIRVYNGLALTRFGLTKSGPLCQKFGHPWSARTAPVCFGSKLDFLLNMINNPNLWFCTHICTVKLNSIPILHHRSD